MKGRKLELAGGLAVAAALAGCMATVPVKQVVKDPAAYVDQFATVSPDVSGKLPRNEPAMAFRRIEIETKSSEVRAEQKGDPRDITTSWVLLNGGGGIVRSYSTVRNNDVPFRINYKVSYRGMMSLKTQAVFLNRDNADFAHEVKSIKRMDSIAVPADGKAEFHFTHGTQPQIANFHEGRDACTWGATKPARDLYASLPGTAIEVTCDNYGANGQVISKTSYAYLSHYGVAVQTGYTDSSLRSTHRVTAVRVE